MKRPLNNARRQEQLDSRALATETTGELHILRVDRDPPGVDRAEVRIVKQADEVGLGRLLQRHDRVALELQVLLEVLSDLAHQALERELTEKELGPLLVAPDLPQGDGSRPVPETGISVHIKAINEKFTQTCEAS